MYTNGVRWQAEVTEDRTYVEIAFKIKHKINSILGKSDKSIRT